MAPFALGSLGAESLLRHRSLLGALVIRPFYLTARSWEHWFEELLTSLGPLGGVTGTSCLRQRLGVKSLLRYLSLLGALVLSTCYVAVRCWEPWC